MPANWSVPDGRRSYVACPAAAGSGDLCQPRASETATPANAAQGNAGPPPGRSAPNGTQVDDRDGTIRLPSFGTVADAAAACA